MLGDPGVTACAPGRGVAVVGTSVDRVLGSLPCDGRRVTAPTQGIATRLPTPLTGRRLKAYYIERMG